MGLFYCIQTKQFGHLLPRHVFFIHPSATQTPKAITAVSSLSAAGIPCCLETIVTLKRVRCSGKLRAQHGFYSLPAKMDIIMCSHLMLC